MREEGTESHRRHGLQSQNTSGGQGRCVLVFKITHISMLPLPGAFEGRIKLEELEKPTRFSNLLSPCKEWPGQYNCAWDVFSMKGLSTSPLKAHARLCYHLDSILNPRKGACERLFLLD